MKITYIHHSCFLVETTACYYLFDYYKGELPSLHPDKPILVFASHDHSDHYNPEIFRFLLKENIKQITAVLSDDIPCAKHPEDIPCFHVGPHQTCQLPGETLLHTFRSTDAGVAFLLQCPEGILYHAGDLHDWVWDGEPEEENLQMTRNYRREIDLLHRKLQGHSIDAAFLLLDPRQEKDYDRGILYFLDQIPVTACYPMHYWGQPEIIGQFLEEYPQYREKIQYTEHKLPPNKAKETEHMNFKMVHENYNVADLDTSLAFYKKALGLHEKRRKTSDSFTIVYIGNDSSDFELELTCLKDHPQKYDLGECEFHLAFRTEDYEAAHKLHEEMGCICYENTAMGIYFIEDPDGYWLEIVPAR